MASIEIDAEKCKGCYLCVRACAKKVIGQSQTANKSGYFPAEKVAEGCIGCTMCAVMCPDVCIKVER